MIYIQLNRRYREIIVNQRENWCNIDNPNLENPTIHIKEIIQKIEYLCYKLNANDKHALNQFKKGLKIIVFIKKKLDEVDWSPSGVPAKGLPKYYEDLNFFLGILYLVQQAINNWYNFLPQNILPPSCAGKANIPPKAFEATVGNLKEPDILKWVDTTYKQCELEKAIEGLEPLADKYKGYDFVSSLVCNLKKGLSEFVPKTKADEDQILSLLKKIKIYLNNKPSWLNTIYIISHTYATGLLMPSYTNNSLSKIFAECFKFKDPVPILGRLKASVKQDIKTHQKNPFDNPELTTNASGALSLLQDAIKSYKKTLNSQAANNIPQIGWYEHLDVFLDHFGKWIQYKKICIPNHKDLNQTIQLIANIFLVPKERGDGYLSPSTLAKYLNNKINGTH